MPAPHTSPRPISDPPPTIALVRDVSDSIADCELTHLARQPIDIDRARFQHAQYLAALTSVGCQLESLPPLHDCPDAVFVEDTALVLDEVAVITRPGAASRQPEIHSTIDALQSRRNLLHITAPGTLDGGDILVLGKHIWVGEPANPTTARSNRQGIEQLRQHLSPFGYAVHTAPMTDCLHLKTGVTAVGPNQLIINPTWVDPDIFAHLNGIKITEAHPDEPTAANALLIGDHVIYPDHCPRTQERLEAAGINLTLVPADELAKAEGGVTCSSIIVR